MTPFPPFKGFPKKGLDFFRDLREYNNRDWFNENKNVYIENVIAPAQSFIVELGEKLSKTLENIRYDTRATGSGSIMRINKDVRFSKDKTPYRTRLGIIFWEGPGKKMDHSGFHLGLGDNMLVVHGGMHGFSKAMLSKYRDAIVQEETGEELIEIITKLKSSGYSIGGSYYKRVPRGYSPEHERADFLLHNALYAEYSKIPRKVIGTPELIDQCLLHFKAMFPLHNWLVERDLS